MELSQEQLEALISVANQKIARARQPHGFNAVVGHVDPSEAPIVAARNDLRTARDEYMRATWAYDAAKEQLERATGRLNRRRAALAELVGDEV